MGGGGSKKDDTTHLSSKQLVEIKKGAGGRTDVGSSFILAKVLT